MPDPFQLLKKQRQNTEGLQQIMAKATTSQGSTFFRTRPVNECTYWVHE